MREIIYIKGEVYVRFYEVSEVFEVFEVFEVRKMVGVRQIFVFFWS